MVNIIEIFSIFFLLLLIYLNFFRFKDFLYPPVIQSALWGLIIILYFFNKASFNQISMFTYIVILGSSVSFSLGSYIITLNFRFNFEMLKDNIKVARHTYVSKLFFWISLLTLPLFIYKAYQLSLIGPFNSFYLNLRAVLSWGLDTNGYGILAYVIPISYINAGMQLLISFNNKKITLTLISIIIAIIYSILSTGRTFFVLFFLFIIGIAAITRRVSLKKAFIFLLIVVILSFYFIGFNLGKINESKTLTDSFKEYLLSPIVAYDTFIQSSHKIDMGNNTFRFIFAVLDKAGFSDITVPNLVQEYTYVPMPTNVYTIFYHYSKDFSVVGVFIIFLLLGLISGYIYKNALKGNISFILLYGLLLYPLIMQFFQEQYFTLLSLWLQFLIYITLYKLSLGRGKLVADSRHYNRKLEFRRSII